jgi:hypothetical protein
MSVHDYKKLLKSYLRLVVDAEGFDFLDYFRADSILTAEEMVELKQLSKEVWDEQRKQS